MMSDTRIQSIMRNYDDDDDNDNIVVMSHFNNVLCVVESESHLKYYTDKTKQKIKKKETH